MTMVVQSGYIFVQEYLLFRASDIRTMCIYALVVLMRSSIYNFHTTTVILVQPSSPLILNHDMVLE